MTQTNDVKMVLKQLSPFLEEKKGKNTQLVFKYTVYLLEDNLFRKVITTSYVRNSAKLSKILEK